MYIIFHVNNFWGTVFPTFIIKENRTHFREVSQAQQTSEVSYKDNIPLKGLARGDSWHVGVRPSVTITGKSSEQEVSIPEIP